MRHTSQDGTEVLEKDHNKVIGTGLFQVQETPWMEKGWAAGPEQWRTIRRFPKLSEAEEWCKATPTNWANRRIFVEPKEV